MQKLEEEHERSIRELTGLAGQLPKRVIVLKSMIHGHRPAITEKEEADALLPFYPQKDRIDIDLCDITDLAIAKGVIDEKVKKYISDSDGSELYAAFIMATIPLSCYLGYAIGNKIPVQSFQHFRDTEDWKWRDSGEGYIVELPDIGTPCSDVKLFVNISGTIDESLTASDHPVYAISANAPGFSFLQSWEQVKGFRTLYRDVLNKIRETHGESVAIHLYPATPNPINFEIGKGIMKNLDPTIILYDKTESEIEYKEVMHLHDRIRE